MGKPLELRNDGKFRLLVMPLASTQGLTAVGCQAMNERPDDWKPYEHDCVARLDDAEMDALVDWRLRATGRVAVSVPTQPQQQPEMVMVSLEKLQRVRDLFMQARSADLGLGALSYIGEAHNLLIEIMHQQSVPEGNGLHQVTLEEHIEATQQGGPAAVPTVTADLIAALVGICEVYELLPEDEARLQEAVARLKAADDALTVLGHPAFLALVRRPDIPGWDIDLDEKILLECSIVGRDLSEVIRATAETMREQEVPHA